MNLHGLKNKETRAQKLSFKLSIQRLRMSSNIFSRFLELILVCEMFWRKNSPAKATPEISIVTMISTLFYLILLVNFDCFEKQHEQFRFVSS